MNFWKKISSMNSIGMTKILNCCRSCADLMSCEQRSGLMKMTNYLICGSGHCRMILRMNRIAMMVVIRISLPKWKTLPVSWAYRFCGSLSFFSTE